MTSAHKIFAKRLGRRLKETRMQAGLGSRELCRKAKLTPSMVSKYEAGERLPGSLAIVKLCEALTISADHLLGISDAERLKALRKSINGNKQPWQ